MKCFTLVAVIVTSFCGCNAVQRQPVAAFEGISPGMTQTEILDAIPAEVEVVRHGTDFMTVQYPIGSQGEMRISHLWFLDGRLKTVPGR